MTLLPVKINEQEDSLFVSSCSGKVELCRADRNMLAKIGSEESWIFLYSTP